LNLIGTAEMNKTLQREIYQARNIQMTLLNGEKPELPNGEVAGVSLPARLIGGDYYDFYPLSNGKIRIIIGDVMGKGIPAAMLMILTRAVFRSVAGSTESPGETLTVMNNAVYHDLRKLRSFVTVLCADWDPATNTLEYANAGHTLPVIVRAQSGLIHPPELKGIMLGGLPGQYYQNQSLQLEKEDLVFFYTDGIVEAQSKDGEFYKLERLEAVLTQNWRLHAEDIQTKVMERLDEFTDGLPQKDDITMVILKVGQG
jgi:sigma-B regulation protein RsbU (phosphoserine phosphatase)